MALQTTIEQTLGIIQVQLKAAQALAATLSEEASKVQIQQHLKTAIAIACNLPNDHSDRDHTLVDLLVACDTLHQTILFAEIVNQIGDFHSLFFWGLLPLAQQAAAAQDEARLLRYLMLIPPQEMGYEDWLIREIAQVYAEGGQIEVGASLAATLRPRIARIECSIQLAALAIAQQDADIAWAILEKALQHIATLDNEIEIAYTTDLLNQQLLELL